MRTLETERLLLRPFTDDDMAIHETVFSDPEVCRYYCGKTRTPEETREWLIHRRWQARGDRELGFTAVIRKSDSRLMGLVALQHYVAWWVVWESAPDLPYNTLEIELSYALGREFWGNGYITEAGRALIDFAFREMRLKRLVNSIAPENARSLGVVKRLGFRPERNLNPEDTAPVWVLDNPLVEPGITAKVALSAAEAEASVDKKGGPSCSMPTA